MSYKKFLLIDLLMLFHLKTKLFNVTLSPMEVVLFGFLNINKPIGITSHSVISTLRKVSGIKQIGHAGTLDPFAEGVLPVAIGKATRLIEYLSNDKAYIGRFCFGKSTTTFDTEGETVQEFDQKVMYEELVKNLPETGMLEQIPPIYSAKKVNGKKLYEYARKGEEVDIKPHFVELYKIEVVEFNQTEQWADILIECSKGTYIRSIADKLGKSLNNGCYLSKLKRIKSGRFNIEKSVKLEDIKTIKDIEENLANPLEYISGTKQELNDTEYKRTMHGMSIYNRTNSQDGIVILSRNNKLIAISEVAETELKIKKVVGE